MQSYTYFSKSPVIGLALILSAGLLHAEIRPAGSQSQPGSTGITRQQNNAVGITQQGTTGTSGMRSVQRASELLNMHVTSKDGQMAGKVNDIVLSSDGRRVEYVAVDMHDSNQRISVPLKELSVSPDGKTLSLTSSQADLQRHNRLTNDQWPSTADMGTGQMISKNDLDSRRISKLIGKEVESTSGGNLGSINDLIINMDQGQITTAALETGGVMGVGSKIASVDWPSVQIQSGRDFATVNQTKQQLQNSAASKEEYWQRFGFEGEDENRGIMRSDDKTLNRPQQVQPQQQNQNRPIQRSTQPY